MKQKGLFFFAFVFSFFAFRIEAQILTSTPAFPTQTDQITVYYDATTGNGDLTGYTPIYAHTGVITNNSVGPNDWQHTVGNWGTADASVLMTPMGNNIHKIVITPSTFYNLNVGETVTKMMFVFRNAQGTVVGRNADGSDIYLNIYAAGFNASFSQPTLESQIVNANQVVPVTANSSLPSDISISVNGSQVASGTGVTSWAGAGTAGRRAGRSP